MNSPGERDQTVDRLLRRSLATTPRGGVTDACPDAETLAAWSAGALSGSALEGVHAHVADCARCQDLAGTLVRISATVPAAEPVHASRRWLAWFVPLTAAAAAVAIWFAVPGTPGGPANDGQLARVEQAPQPPNEPVPPPAGNREAFTESPAVPAPAAPAEVREERARNDAPQQTAIGETAAKKEATADLAKDKADATPPPAAPAAIAAAPQPVAGAASQAAAAPPAERAAAARSSVRAAETASEIVSPDPAVRWRILGATVQHSINGGSTWEAVSTGVPAELTAGAAPAATVCWLVGRNGVVLLTIDGRTWRRVPFPEMTDLSAVRTVDAGGRVASVSTADGRTFVTTDAGATWSMR